MDTISFKLYIKKQNTLSMVIVRIKDLALSIKKTIKVKAEL